MIYISLIVSVEEELPLKQGLKPHVATGFTDEVGVEEELPLKQGLKLKYGKD